MAIYEFKCKNCGNVFERLCIKSSDKDNTSCPSCGHKENEVLLSAFSSIHTSNTRKGGNRASLSSCSSSGGFS